MAFFYTSASEPPPKSKKARASSASALQDQAPECGNVLISDTVWWPCPTVVSSPNWARRESARLISCARRGQPGSRRRRVRNLRHQVSEDLGVIDALCANKQGDIRVPEVILERLIHTQNDAAQRAHCPVREPKRIHKRIANGVPREPRGFRINGRIAPDLSLQGGSCRCVVPNPPSAAFEARYLAPISHFVMWEQG